MIDSFTGRYYFLSNFYPNNRDSLEHKFQAAKTHDLIEKAKILAADKPGKAKRLGNLVKLRDDWKDLRTVFMWILMERKFKNPNLGASLLATDNELLVEGNYWHDNFWGDCHCDRLKCITTEGRNVSGKLLMVLRRKLRR